MSPLVVPGRDAEDHPELVEGPLAFDSELRHLSHGGAGSSTSLRFARSASLVAVLLCGGALFAAPGATAPVAADAKTAPAPAAVQPLSIIATATPEKVKLGEPFTYRIVLTHAPDQRYELTTPTDLGSFELTSQTRHREDHGQTSTTTFELKMALFALGAQKVPDLTFEVTDTSGVHRYVAHGGSVEGVSTLPKDAAKEGADLYDIKPNEVVPVRTYRLLWVALALLGAAGLGYAAWRGFKKLRARALSPPPLPPKPLHERTLAALDTLKAEALPAQGRAREFYFRLSEILRGYLGERFRFEALECTSTELLARAEALLSPKHSLGDLSAFVHDSDLVKFAKFEPAAEVCQSALDFGYRLVQQTHPPAVIPANALGPDVPQS